MGQSLYPMDNGMPTLNRDNSEKATKSTATSNKYWKKFILSDKQNRTIETRAGSKTREEDANMVEVQEQGTSVNKVTFKMRPNFGSIKNLAF